MLPATPRSPEPQSRTVRNKNDTQLDVAEEDSLPASDPPSITDPATTIQTPQGKKPV
jgi:hypothetical protein